MVLLSRIAAQIWDAAKHLDQFLPEKDLPTPSWSSLPLQKRADRYFPPLGPRHTDSVCPKCQVEIRDAIIRGKQNVSDLTNPAQLITAEIVEEAGRVIMRKTCESHGPIEDVLADDAKFFWRMESLFPGCDFARQTVAPHGVHDVRYGRGSFLIIDLTTRCNMKCDPCFMNANEIGHVHELTLEQIKEQLDYALTVQPRREINILFSGGEPTLSPYFLEAVSYARSLGMVRLHVATNGLRFAEDPLFAVAARGAGLHAVYLQLDGSSSQANAHRGISNFFDLKCRALDNISAAGLHVTLQVTVVNGLNNADVGNIVRFAIQHSDKVFGIVFQPVMFTGRDEHVSDERRYLQRYTSSQLAHDLSKQLDVGWEPMRDWFPMGVYGTLCTYTDMIFPKRPRGSTYVNAHPDSAIFSPLVINQKTGQWFPLTRFFKLEAFLEDVELIINRACGPLMSRAQLLISAASNFNQSLAPTGFRFRDLRSLLEQGTNRLNGQIARWSESLFASDTWHLMIVGASSFQDLFTYDLANIQMSTALVGDFGRDNSTPSEVPFSFKNAAGWRQVVEDNPLMPSLSEWHQRRGRHEIYANGVCVTVDELTGSLKRLSSQESKTPLEYA